METRVLSVKSITTITAISLLFVLAGIFTRVASAQSPHYKVKGGPNCVDNGLTATCTASITGLGNFDVFIKLDAAAVVNTVCVSPGGNESPGQNPALNVTLSGGLFIPASSIKNGNLSFTVSTAPPPTPPPTGPNSAGCANPNWGVRITDVTFSNGSLTIFQDLNNDGVFTDGSGGTLNEVVIKTTGLTFS